MFHHILHEADFQFDKSIASSATRYAHNIYPPVNFQSSNVVQRSHHQAKHNSFTKCHFSRTHYNCDNFITSVSATHSANAFVSDHFSRMHNNNNCDNGMPSDSVSRAFIYPSSGHAHDSSQRLQSDTVATYFSRIHSECMLVFSGMINSRFRLKKNDAHMIYPQHSPKLSIDDGTFANCSSSNMHSHNNLQYQQFRSSSAIPAATHSFAYDISKIRGGLLSTRLIDFQIASSNVEGGRAEGFCWDQ